MAKMSSDARPTQEQPIRVKGGPLFLGVQMGILVTLGLAVITVVFKAGAIERQVLLNTEDVKAHGQQLQEINVSLARLTAIAAASLEGKEIDRASLVDIRARLSAMEGKR